MMEKRRIKLTVAYDGTDYCGWQIQPNGITVEEVLNRACSEALKEDIRVLGASRTDAGVHAQGNVAVIDISGRIPAEKVAVAINQKLPGDITVVSSEEVSKEFHPRYRATRKTYEYAIYNAKMPSPLRRRYTTYFYQPLDIDLMREGAFYLLGRHDFASFCSAKSPIKSTVRTIESIEIMRRDQNEIVIRVSGDGFLYNMVRMIAGVLMRVGVGFYPPGEVKKILDMKTRGYARPTAPACGLTLIGIEYPEIRCPWATREIEIAYHDREWGVPVHDDRKLFEMLILEGQQAGLSWLCILNKREAMRKAFDGFDPDICAAYTDEKIEALMQNADIIRSRRKLEALRKNAQAFIKVREEFGSFDAYLWGFLGQYLGLEGDVAPEPIVNGWDSMEEVPQNTELSDLLSIDLKKRGFSFVGTTIVYSFLQAVGVVNDHLIRCFRQGEIRDYYEVYVPEKAEQGTGREADEKADR